METALSSITGLVGVVIGALLQWIFSRRTERATKGFEQQIGVYSRFLVWDRAGLDDKAITEACRARTLLAVYASRETVKAIADYERLGGVACSNEQRAAFVAVFNAIRHDMDLPPLDGDDLLTLMYFEDAHEKAGVHTA